MRLKSVLYLLLTFFTSRQCVESYKILGVFPVAGKSVNILYNRLMKGLADAGHDVVVISAYKNKLPIENGSYTDIELTGFPEKYNTLLDTADLFATPEEYPLWESQAIHEMFLPFYNETFTHPNVQNFLMESHKFDVVLTEYLWSDSLSIFSVIYNCPLVFFTSMGGVNTWINDMVGNPMPISYVPHFWFSKDYSDEMSFSERLLNLIYYMYDPPIHNHFVSFPDHNKILRTVFPNPPDVSDLYHTPSLVLLGSHSSIRQAIPLAPNMVEIGGFHIDPPKKLPEDLQRFLDDAKYGAIFFSMGSHIKASQFSDEKKRIILNVFQKMKLKVLWKFEDEVLIGKPENVLIKKWFPQMDILAHPNIKLFITHGGYGSTLETIYHGKPALMIPVFADQFSNAKQAEGRGYAIKLPYNDPSFTENTFYSLINEMLTNPKYTEKAKHFSQLFHDRPIKPLDTGIYWIEYVIRHKGADHLKLAGRKLPWYKFYMVDVLVFLLGMFFIVAYVILYCFKAIFFSRVSKKIKQS